MGLHDWLLPIQRNMIRRRTSKVFVNDYKKFRAPLFAKVLAAYLRTRLRGRTRLLAFLAHNFKSLRVVPIIFENHPPVYVDLRFDMADYLLSGSPWKWSPFEVDEQLVMRAIIRPGDNVFDIGANWGLHTALLSELIGPNGKLCIFEPNRELIPLLERTVSGMKNSTLFPFGLSDHSGESILFVPNDHSMGSLADYTGAPDLEEWRMKIGLTKAQCFPCEIKTIDELVENKRVPHPDFMKVDVEGCELMVFSGGVMTLDRPDAPIIMFESREECSRGFGLNKSSALEFLRSLSSPGYVFFEIKEGGVLSPLNLETYISPNLLAVPQRLLGRVEKLILTTAPDALELNDGPTGG